MRTYCLFIMLCLVSINLKAQYWEKIYSKVNHQLEGKSIIQMYDGGFVFVVIDYSGKPQLYKIDVDGNLIFKKTINARPMTIIATKDGGLCIGGIQTQYSTPNQSAYIIKLDACFNTQWCYFFGDQGPPLINGGGWVQSLVEGTDSSLFACALYTGADTTYDHWVDVLKFDYYGNLLWQNDVTHFNLSLNNSPYANSMIATNDGGVLTTGDALTAQPPGANFNWDRVYLNKVSSSGNLDWTSHLGDSSSLLCAGVASRNMIDSGFLSLGVLANPYTGRTFPTIFRTDSTGHLQWYKLLLDSNNYWLPGFGDDIKEIDNNVSIVMAGRQTDTTNNNATTYCLLMLKIDSMGNVLDSAYFPNTYFYAGSMALTSDNKIVVCGTRNDSAGLNQQVIVYKFNYDLDIDTAYNLSQLYDSLCAIPIVSDTINFNCSPLTSINEFDSPINNLLLYPNPASNSITLKGELLGNTQLVIYNSSGQVQKTIALKTATTNYTMDCSTFNNGFYVLKIIGKDGRSKSAKFIIQK